MDRTKFVVIGCSRSGTTYTAELLTEIGHPCGHERIFNVWWVNDIESPYNHFARRPDLQGDSSFLAVPFLSDLPAGTVVLHQVRHPVPVIRSHKGMRFFAEPYEPNMWLADEHPDFLRFLRTHCPTIFQGDEIRRCMRYWVMWNRMAQQAEQMQGLRYLRYSVEALDLPLLREIVAMVGGDPEDKAVPAALASVPRTTNTRLRDDSISWTSLPEGEEKEAIRQLALEYGYTVEREAAGSLAA